MVVTAATVAAEEAPEEGWMVATGVMEDWVAWQVASAAREGMGAMQAEVEI